MTTTLSKQNKNNDLSIFHPFTKVAAQKQKASDYCVIYTRVSGARQEKGESLETQFERCQQLAQRCKLQVMGCFGGKSESAKTDERKEFNRMLDFIKKSKQPISYIIVYSVDRFSRTGGNAIYLKEQLKKRGILLLSYLQPVDVATSSGNFQQNMLLLMSQYENEQRREKIIAGMEAKMRKGYIVTRVPRGYSVIKENGQRRFVINKTGKLIAKIFHWKANDGLSYNEIVRRCREQGLKLCHPAVLYILQNPFYCGLLTHELLNGEVIEGVHPPIVSRELFLKANGIMNSAKRDYAFLHIEEQTPLKRFARCGNCGWYLRSYQSKGKYYYKCNHKGCRCNVSAEKLNQSFKTLLADFSIRAAPTIRQRITTQMVVVYNQQNREELDRQQALQQRAKDLRSKLQRLEQRFIDEELTKDLYQKHSQQTAAELAETEAKMNQRGVEVSNLEKAIEKAIEFAEKLPSLWDLSDYEGKQKLQFLVFPEGIHYTTQKGWCLTPKINTLLLQITRQARILQTPDQQAGGNFLPNVCLLYRTDFITT